MGIEDEIKKEANEIYHHRYGKRNPNTLSTKENEAVVHEAAKKVQERRRRERK